MCVCELSGDGALIIVFAPPTPRHDLNRYPVSLLSEASLHFCQNQYCTNIGETRTQVRDFHQNRQLDIPTVAEWGS